MKDVYYLHTVVITDTHSRARIGGWYLVLMDNWLPTLMTVSLWCG